MELEELKVIFDQCKYTDQDLEILPCFHNIIYKLLNILSPYYKNILGKDVGVPPHLSATRVYDDPSYKKNKFVLIQFESLTSQVSILKEIMNSFNKAEMPSFDILEKIPYTERDDFNQFAGKALSKEKIQEFKKTLRKFENEGGHAIIVCCKQPQNSIDSNEVVFLGADSGGAENESFSFFTVNLNDLIAQTWLNYQTRIQVLLHNNNKEVRISLSNVTSCNSCQGNAAIKRCSYCYNTFYCNQECQKKDWDSHKLNCGFKRALKFQQELSKFMNSEELIQERFVSELPSKSGK
jgi:hypothetical protein